MQLVAYGAQDIYLTGNPQITFFKVVYRRHTNFAMESIEQTFNGNVALGRRVTATISRNGDLIKDMWLECDFDYRGTDTDSPTDDAKPVYGLGNALVKQVEVEIGGQLIDRQYGEWLDIWSELSTPEGKRVGYDEMVGNTADSVTPKRRLDVPLMFWFNRNPGLALPLIALQYHEVKINLELETAANLSTNASSTEDIALGADGISFWVDYIYLDTDERRRFAQVSHEYLIEQVQFTGDESCKTGSAFRADLSFNHPCKELIWVGQTANGARGSGNAASQPCKFASLSAAELTGTTPNAAEVAKLQLNGHDRFTERRLEYFLRVQTYKHHTHMPRANRHVGVVSGGEPGVEDQSQYIYVYSFALNPEDHQPSGTCNFSRIDNAVLSITKPYNDNADGIIKIFAVNYNVLRIMSGMGGLAYSN
jgi:hypothetical protein